MGFVQGLYVGRGGGSTVRRRRRTALCMCEESGRISEQGGENGIDLEQVIGADNPGLVALNGGSGPNGGVDDPFSERPPLVLTRRVTVSSFRRKTKNEKDTLLQNSLPLSLRRSNAKVSAPVEPGSTSQASFLQREEALYAFYVEAGGVGEMYNLTTPRRSSDPPQRFLEINFGYVLPGSRHSFNCSNPRVTGTLRQWYETAHSWGLLRRTSRDVLTFDSDRRPVRTESDQTIHRPNRRASSDKEAGRFTRLLNAGASRRSADKEPRVIAIGDVHGCIDELQELMRVVGYRPGDQVIFLGDLVAKGPDSVSVVQLAREINAKSVRGNHDHEVVKWREAVNRGERPPLVSLEHYRIARALSPEDQEWLRACPWFISAPDLGVLFVHAGFIPGTRLSQQNPRLMMNMRSVLVDGTVTAKHVPTKEWARLWPGPETVVFGHDAFRGLQQHPYACGVDTGCVYGGRLTALILPENRFASVQAKRQYVTPPRGWNLV
ncbi:hypothetical protein NDN08_005770 [Rhodosorus marinus]|uniref:Calcineurin-like phosphoesterase domain-containing protein n=1 Tax=Rhodosorus marinus TaxID=101924 RepID=A0AAV8V4B0_9RHOD|nr:hypothetical protein NDN08_005770 [Rhodosorus marinus]